MIRPITKSAIRHQYPEISNTDELCGLACIAMMVDKKNPKVTIPQLYKLLGRGNAYIKGLGLVMSRVPKVMRGYGIIYSRYLPYWLIVILLKFGYIFAASIKTPKGNHIVFVYKTKRASFPIYHFPELMYIDPNKSESSSPLSMSYTKWKKLTNHRLLLTKGNK